MAKGEIKKFNKEKQARLYALYLSIPLSIRNLAHNDLVRLGYVFEDVDMELVLKCKNKSEFSEHFGISRKQLTVWDNSDKFRGLVQKISSEKNVLKYKQDIDYAFTKKTIATADPARVKLWYQLYQGWKEGVDLSAKFLPFQIIIRKQNEKPQQQS